jgi:hypothetical protein
MPIAGAAVLAGFAVVYLGYHLRERPFIIVKICLSWT